MNFGIGDYFVKDKSCLVDDPWEARGADENEKRQHWSRCAGERATANFYMGTIVLIIIVLIASLIYGAINGAGYGIAVFVLGTIGAVGLSYGTNIFWGRKQAELVMDNYLNELASAKARGEPENAFVDRKRAEKMQMHAINAMRGPNQFNRPINTFGNPAQRPLFSFM
jgi:hypothetical protein